ncbi:MAG TPA: YetF domain-containing protein [Gemmatimonadaceae bacterium]|nr:YetF domain-containing protein [Gemmatimonadaceae bacterium]
MRRAIVLTGKQQIGLPILALLPVLALAHLLGPNRAGVVGRTALTYVVLLAGLRVLGKRDLSQLTPFEAILLFLIPQLFRNYLVGQDDSLLTALVAATTLLALVYVTSALAFSSPRLKGLVASDPSVLVRDGLLVEREMQRERIGPEDIDAALRQHGVEHLSQVKLAMLEADGSISIIRKSQ